MLWLILSVIVPVLILISIMVRVRIRREYGREAVQDLANVRAYDKVNWIPAFGLVRRIMVTQLKKWHASGWLVDAGCGPGHLIRDIGMKLDGLSVVGLDINRDMLGIAHRRVLGIPLRQRPDLCRGDVQSLPFQDNSMDFVISTLSLHHWPDAEQAFTEFRRVLKPGGRLLILDMKRDAPLVMYAFLWIAQALAPRPIRQGNGAMGSFQASYTCGELRKMLAPCRFRELSVTPHFGWLVVSGAK